MNMDVFKYVFTNLFNFHFFKNFIIYLFLLGVNISEFGPRKKISFPHWEAYFFSGSTGFEPVE